MAEIEKLDGKTMDIVEQNIEQLKKLFPSVFSEGKVQFNKLEELLGNYLVEDEDHYNFTWHGKRKAGRLAQTPSTGTLRPAKDESVNWDNTENLFIEGDNLEVLKLLQKSYHHQVKMIYIDPPYNTGNDFVYEDDFKDGVKNYLEMTGQVDSDGKKMGTNSSTAGRYHTNWLNMMYSRLKLARNLMRDDGVIFISIDDNEASNLKKICDEVFGEDNFVGIFSVNSTPNARDYGHIGKMHEYVLFYVKNIATTETNLIPDLGKKFSYQDETGPYNIHPLYNSNESFHSGNRPNLYYPFYLYPSEAISDEFYKIGLEKKPDSIEIYPPLSQRNSVQFVWRWGKSKALENLNEEIVGYQTSSGEYRIVQKMRHSEKLIRSLLIDKSYSTRRGTAEVESLFNSKVFSFPKPLELLNILAFAGLSENDIALDLFAGSGTTAHAVMKLNVEDGGNRKCISVQLPEETDEKSEAFKAGYTNIADISKERIRRAGKKIKEENPDYNGDLGFKVFKLDSSNIKRWDADFDTLESDLMDAVDYLVKDRTDEDVLYELCLKLGLDLSIKIEEKTIAGKKLFILGRGYLVVCLDNAITMDLVNGIGALKDELDPEDGMRVVFKDDGFKDDVVKTNALQTLKRFGIDDIKSL